MVDPEVTREDGIKFTVPVVGDGSEDDPFRPAIFDAHPEAYFHLESIDPAANEAVLWINTNRSPDASINDVAEERNPLGSVLKDRRS